ncbi:MAG: hypothetical protein V4576_01650 [Patescibacteria group bacterium]
MSKQNKKFKPQHGPKIPHMAPPSGGAHGNIHAHHYLSTLVRPPVGKAVAGVPGKLLRTLNENRAKREAAAKAADAAKVSVPVHTPLEPSVPAVAVKPIKPIPVPVVAVVISSAPESELIPEPVKRRVRSKKPADPDATPKKPAAKMAVKPKVAAAKKAPAKKTAA